MNNILTFSKKGNYTHSEQVTLNVEIAFLKQFMDSWSRIFKFSPFQQIKKTQTGTQGIPLSFRSEAY